MYRSRRLNKALQSANEVFEEEALVEESLVEEARAEKSFAEEEEGPKRAQKKEAIAEGALRDQNPGEDVQVKVNSAEEALAEESLAQPIPPLLDH